MKNFIGIFKNEDVFQSSKPASISAFLLVAVILTALLSVRYYLYQNLIVNGIAQKTILAKNTFEVVDKQKTEVLKREVANKIRPVVAPVEGDYIKTDLHKAINDIERIRKEKKSYQVKQRELSDLLDISDSTRKTKAIAFILSANQSELNSVFTNASYLLNEVLSVGIFDSDIANVVTDTFVDKTLNTHIKKNQYPLIRGLIEHSVFPNLIIDEYATDIARKNAKNAVKPYVVTFKKGDKILQTGEKVTQLKRDALKHSGYNAFELNRSGIAGIFALICLTMGSLVLYVKEYEKKFYTPRYMLYTALSSIILVYACIIISNSSIISNYMMPFVTYTMILAILTNPILSFLVSILMLSILSVTLFFDSQLIYVFVCAILSSSYLVSKISYSKRFDIIWCGFQVGFVMFLAMFFVLLFEAQTSIVGALAQMQNQNPFLGILNGLVSSMLAMFLIPIIEKVCKITSPYALIELADQNQELLSKLRSAAPGTFHHSLMVANLCEEAAIAIGANSILARVGAFYHDIGKLQRPLFFIENQSYFGVENPHTTLTPRQSKMVITLHTKDGAEIAKKYGLPQAIIDFIQQHHGECLAGHFYTKAIEEEGEENVIEGQFRYPGPKPQTKETAILMLADAIESAVRSLKNPTQEEVESIINKIFTDRLNDGQLSDSPLTLKDINTIGMTFNKVLRGMQHERIKYQERVMDEITNKEKFNTQASIQESIKDEEFEKKIQELQAKSNKKENNDQ